MITVEIAPWQQINSDEVTSLYQQAGWLEPSDERDIVQEILKHTFAFAIAKLDGKIIGMGRCISDGVSDAYIQDVYVHQNHRGKKIGKMIIETLLDHLKSKKIGWIGLIGNPGTDKFYKPLGFEIMNDYIPMKYNSKNHHE